MSSWLPFRSANTVAVDFSVSSIALLALSGSQKKPKVKYFALGATPAGSIKDNMVADVSLASAALKELLKTAKCKDKAVAIAALGTNVVVKEILMDKGLNEEEIESAAWVEVIKQFPDISKVSLDFDLLDDSPKHPNKQSVLIAAYRNDHLQKTLKTLTDSGLKPHIIDISYYAMARACDILIRQLPKHQAGRPVGLINLGKEWTKKVVILDGKVVHQYDHTFSGEQLLSRMKTLLKVTDLLPLNETKPMNIPKKKLTDYTKLIKTLLLPQIERYINFFYTTTESKSFDHLFLSGDCALLPHIDKIITESCGIPTSVANPFLSMTLPKTIDKTLLYHQAPRLLESCGLALHEVYHGAY